MAKVKVIRRGRLTTEERERGFSLGTAPAPLPSYDALRDGNLRQYFESKTVQKFLQGSGWIDKEGRIVDLDKFRSKLNIIEQEFKYAEKTEFWRLKEEEEMRRTIQMKRERALTEAKRIERARRIKEENRIRKGIISAVKNQPSADSAHQMLDMTKQLSAPPEFTQVSRESGEDEEAGGGGFFVTQADTD
eukprot:CAMPEP_0179437432 /NCGR_PEP_ID=MMETSP0799-20121207/21328_1 /TAXON_ID=46947 /ORGANISM="Geminigera cryophila, Strain CCMP2564" /LENGTH=189 /DNA_ID=CAMNT_0021218369 /DNA_START=145 /DNA_END=714 /DNA_ORIENTATION=+